MNFLPGFYLEAACREQISCRELRVGKLWGAGQQRMFGAGTLSVDGSSQEYQVSHQHWLQCALLIQFQNVRIQNISSLWTLRGLIPGARMDLVDECGGEVM